MQVLVSQEQTGLLYQLHKMEALLSLPQATHSNFPNY
jgi:hypothetical protein